MSYSKEIYSKAFSSLAQKRQHAKGIAQRRKNEIYASVPEMQKLESEQNSLGLSISKAVLSDPKNAENIVEIFRHRSNVIIERKNELLRNLSLPENYLEPPYDCLICEDTGFVDGKQCECLKQMLKKLSYQQLNSISNLRLSDFHNFDLSYYPSTPDAKTGIVPQVKMGEIYEYCIKYADSFSKSSRNIIMTGATGLGKTHLSLAIAKIVINQGHWVIYGSAPDIMGLIEQEKFGKTPAGSEKDALSSILECDLLILDDLGSEFKTQFTSSTVYNIVNTRIIRGVPTIINTNLTYRELENEYSPRIASRLTGNYSTLFFFGNDIRTKLKK